MDLPLLGDTWFKLVCDPRIVGAMSDLLGPDINFHNGKAILKPPHFRPRDWGWHQDWPYERHTEPDLAAALIYLHDMDASEGATEVLPASHKAGEWEHVGKDGLFSIPQERIGPSARAVPVRAGDVLFIHVQVVHRAGINESAYSRCGVINEYKTAAARDLWGNKLAFAELPLARNGHPFMQLA
jgi:ectoine hydroxylase-related dioxygenase (phytanoyl-CoA dioxygenase family)